ncbi:hypothetical protein P8452_44626 [Trifolium repens]|nr:hypothetical protein P8452_44626 [Trifolium repens]
MVRRLPSDSGAFADWAATSSSTVRAAAPEDLSLGFNAGPTAGNAGPSTGPTTGIWSGGGGGSRSVNYGPEMGMFVVAPSPYHPHHHHHSHHNNHHEAIISDPHSLNPATALGVGVIPLLTASPCLENERQQQGIQFWHEQQQQHQHHSNYLKKHQGFLDHHHINTSPTNLVHHGGGGGGLTVSGTSSGGGTTTCQDCGNQAKKDCSNRRCRTCCKSRGFDCPTHVKSTWVPAARRRERLASAGTTTVVAAGGSSGSTSGAKKPRLIASQTTSHTSTSNTTPPRSFDTTSSHQDAGFKESMPGQVRAPAVFKCVRVTSVDDGKDEYAYQAVVKIGGHVFKGFLYDHGVESREVYPNLSELHLGGGGGNNNNGGANRNGVSSSSPMLDPSHDVYAAASSGVGGLLGGSAYDSKGSSLVVLS